MKIVFSRKEFENTFFSAVCLFQCQVEDFGNDEEANRVSNTWFFISCFPEDDLSSVFFQLTNVEVDIGYIQKNKEIHPDRDIKCLNNA